MNTFSTHVLDLSRGFPAAGIQIVLEERRTDGAFTEIGRGKTDSDGRLKNLVPGLPAGTYRITFDVDAYFSAQGIEAFFPEALVLFRLKDGASHYHVPLLLSPFGYSTYRGS